MSLLKRDGINDRYYLIHKPDTSPEVLAEADLCIRDMLNGTARENHNGTPLPEQLLGRFFLVGERDDGFTVFPPCTVLSELRPEDVDEELLRFAWIFSLFPSL